MINDQKGGDFNPREGNFFLKPGLNPMNGWQACSQCVAKFNKPIVVSSSTLHQKVEFNEFDNTTRDFK